MTAPAEDHRARARFIRVLELSPVKHRATWWVAGRSYGAIAGDGSDPEAAVMRLFRRTEEVRDLGVMDKVVDEGPPPGALPADDPDRRAP